MSDTLKIALYGKYGTRKTLQIKSLAETYGADKVLVVSAEHGLQTIGDSVSIENIIVIDDLDDMRGAWATVSKKAKDTSWWVCIDGMSRVMQWVSNEQFSGADKYFEQLARHEEIDEDLKQYGRYITDGGKIDALRIYGRIGRDSENVLSSWIKLPCNLYCNYLEDETGSDGSKKTLPYGPDVPGKVGLKAVMSSFDHVARLSYDKNGELLAGLDPASSLYLARTREDRSKVKLPKTIEGFELGPFTKKLIGAN